MNNVLTLFSVILIVIGIFAYAYTTSTTDIFGNELVENPYRYWSYYVIIIGVILLIIGLALPSVKEKYMITPLP